MLVISRYLAEVKPNGDVVFDLDHYEDHSLVVKSDGTPRWLVRETIGSCEGIHDGGGCSSSCNHYLAHVNSWSDLQKRYAWFDEDIRDHVLEVMKEAGWLTTKGL